MCDAEGAAETLRATIVTLESGAAAMSATASDLREDLAARTTRCRELEGLTSSSEAQKAQLGERQRALEAEVEGLHMGLAEARGRVLELDATVLEVEARAEDLDAKLTEAGEDGALLELALQTSHRREETVREQLEMVEAEVLSIRSASGQASAALFQQVEALVHDLEQGQRAVADRGAACEAARGQLETELADARREVWEKTATNTSLETRIWEESQAFFEKEAELDAARVHSLAVDRMLELTTATLEETQRRAGALEEAAAASEELRKRLTETAKELDKLGSVGDAAVVALEGELATTANLLRTALAMVVSLEEKAASREVLLREVKDNGARRQAELAAAAAELRQQVAQKTGAVRRLEAAFLDLGQQLAKAREAEHAAEAAAAKELRQLTSVHSLRIQELDIDLSAKASTIDVLRSTISETESQHRQSRQSVYLQTERTLVQMREELGASTRAFETVLGGLQASVGDVERDFGEEQTRSRQLAQEKTTLSAHCQRLQEELRSTTSGLERQVRDLEDGIVAERRRGVTLLAGLEQSVAMLSALR